jgi:quinol monooxygenase YgiN
MLKNILLLSAVAAVQASSLAAADCCAIVELRQYTLHPGQRDAFIPMFEREFVESQEAVGNTVIGQFRDLDQPDHFTWLRGFADMPARASALQAFYGGEVWKANRDAANAFFIDTDNVLLLHAVRAQSAFHLDGATRAAAGATKNPGGLWVATIYAFAAPADEGFFAYFEHAIKPVLASAGIDVRAYYTSETTPNNFPRLPVRDKDHVFVWFAQFKDEADFAAHRARLEGLPAWLDAVVPELKKRLQSPAEVLRLTPTPRSRLHG